MTAAIEPRDLIPYVLNMAQFRRLVALCLENMGAANMTDDAIREMFYPCSTEDAAFALVACGFDATIDDCTVYAATAEHGVEFDQHFGYRWTERNVGELACCLLHDGHVNEFTRKRMATGKTAVASLADSAALLQRELTARKIQREQN